MRVFLVLLMMLVPVATAAAQPSAPDTVLAPQPVPPPPPPPPGQVPTCRLATPPPPPDTKSTAPTYESPQRQFCEDELSKDAAWWFDLEARLRGKIHRQSAREITTNNRHVVIAYAAMWLLAIGFVVVMWRRQQALKAEIERLARELAKAEKA